MAQHKASDLKSLESALRNKKAAAALLKELADSGVDLVFVLGHPGYYPKFGFQTAGLAGFQAPYPIPSQHADAWMVQELNAGVIGSIDGRVQCSKILDQPQHWRE